MIWQPGLVLKEAHQHCGFWRTVECVKKVHVNVQHYCIIAFVLCYTTLGVKSVEVEFIKVIQFHLCLLFFEIYNELRKNFFVAP